MKKRKKYVAIMCAALLAFSSLLQGCGKTETASKNSTKEVLSESSEQQSTEPDKITFAFFCNLINLSNTDGIKIVSTALANIAALPCEDMCFKAKFFSLKNQWVLEIRRADNGKFFLHLYFSQLAEEFFSKSLQRPLSISAL